MCMREASLSRIPKPCAIHGVDPPDGWTRTGGCRACKNAYLRKYRSSRSDQCAAYESARNPEKRRAQHRQSHHRRRDKILAKNHERTIKRKIRVLAHYSNGSMACAQCDRSRLYSLAIDHVNDMNRKGPDGGTKLYLWLEKNGFPDGFQVLCHNCNTLKSLPTRSSRPDLVRRYERDFRLKRGTILEYSADGKCAQCANNDMRVLSIDHPNMDGAEHRRSLKIIGGNNFYRWLRREGYPDGYRVLCFSCNLADYLERKSECLKQDPAAVMGVMES